MTDWKKLLETCEAEELHLSGAIQPHGFLVHLSLPDRRVLHASANLLPVLGLTPAELLGRPADPWLGAIDPTPHFPPRRSGARSVMPHACRLGGQIHHAVPSPTSEGCILEFHPADAGADDPLPDTPWWSNFGGVDGVAGQCEHAAAEVRALTGFDRAMIYRFADDWSGEVIAESLAEGVPGYRGLRFPASDIPGIARDLYTVNPSRHIPDVGAGTVPILAATPQVGAVDLTRSDLRSVSPVHLQYLRNMGVGGSFSVSILVHARLWGMIACHHREARLVPVLRQNRAIEVARILALHLAEQDATSRMQALESAERTVGLLADRVGRAESVDVGILENHAAILDLVGATGGAFLQGDRCTLFGATPGPAAVQAIAAHCREHARDGFLATDHLAGSFPEAKAWAPSASGLLAVLTAPNERRLGAIQLWFRPEVLRTVTWAGDGTKGVVVVDGKEVLTPRTSFAAWTETMRDHSAPWSRLELLSARRFRSLVLRWAGA